MRKERGTGREAALVSSISHNCLLPGTLPSDGAGKTRREEAIRRKKEKRNRGKNTVEEPA